MGEPQRACLRVQLAALVAPSPAVVVPLRHLVHSMTGFVELPPADHVSAGQVWQVSPPKPAAQTALVNIMTAIDGDGIADGTTQC